MRRDGEMGQMPEGKSERKGRDEKGKFRTHYDNITKARDSVRNCNWKEGPKHPAPPIAPCANK